MTREDALKLSDVQWDFLVNHPEWNNDKEVVLNVVRHDGHAYKNVSKELQLDLDVALQSIKNLESVFQFFPSVLKNNREFITKAVSKNGLVVHYFKNKFFFFKNPLLSDTSIASLAVKNNCMALRYFSDYIKSNKEIVGEATYQNGYAFQWASDELKNDKDFILSFLRSNLSTRSLYYLPKEFKDDRDIIEKAIEQDGWALQYASDRLKNDKEIANLAVERNPLVFEILPESLRKDKDIILNAVRGSVSMCNYVTLPGYKNFEDILSKEGDGFLFSCLENMDLNVRIRVLQHPDFLPTLEQMENINTGYQPIKEIYQLRRDEWLAKLEEIELFSKFNSKII